MESEIQARFEIEMGRCGVLLICFRARAATTQELTPLFRHSCPNGTIVFVMSPAYEVPKGVDYIVPESAEPDAIVEALRSDPQPLTLNWTPHFPKRAQGIGRVSNGLFLAGLWPTLEYRRVSLRLARQWRSRDSRQSSLVPTL